MFENILREFAWDVKSEWRILQQVDEQRKRKRHPNSGKKIT